MPSPTVCFFCAMPGALTTLRGEPWELHQYGCGTVQMILPEQGEVLSTNQSPACRKIAELQEHITNLEGRPYERARRT